MTDTYYNRTGYCTPCDRYYGQHNEGCSLAGVTPACMRPAITVEPCEAGWVASCPSCTKAVEAVNARAARLSIEAHVARMHP